MSKRVYISADYSPDSGDRNVVDTLNKWGTNNLHKVDFVDMAKVTSGSISNNLDCRPCDLKQEFNQQINASSAVIFVVGDKTAVRKAGSICSRVSNDQLNCRCTPYKQNINGSKSCKVVQTSTPGPDDNVGNINAYSYLRHEFEQAKKHKKPIIVIYNSLRKESNWLPSYMEDYKSDAQPFWIKNYLGEKIGNYAYIKEVLGYA